METSAQPVFDLTYQTTEGEQFNVIGVGTNGIVIEYRDGRVELISQDSWQKVASTAFTH